jgi:hypothetical protein
LKTGSGDASARLLLQVFDTIAKRGEMFCDDALEHRHDHDDHDQGSVDIRFERA